MLLRCPKPHPRAQPSLNTPFQCSVILSLCCLLPEFLLAISEVKSLSLLVTNKIFIGLNKALHLLATTGCKQRVVANGNKWLGTTSGCWHVWGRGFLKVGICIDDETWEKD